MIKLTSSQPSAASLRLDLLFINRTLTGPAPKESAGAKLMRSVRSKIVDLTNKRLTSQEHDFFPERSDGADREMFWKALLAALVIGLALVLTGCEKDQPAAEVACVPTSVTYYEWGPPSPQKAKHPYEYVVPSSRRSIDVCIVEMHKLTAQKESTP